MKLKTTVALMAMVSPFAIANVDLNVCGGTEGGYYYILGSNIATNINDQLGGKYNVSAVNVETYGSLDNIDLMADGECDIAVMQGDAGSFAFKHGHLPSNVKTYQAHTEAVHYLANIENDFLDLEDIEKREDVVVVLVDGSGSYAFMRNIAAEDKGYKVNFENAILADDSYEAAQIAAQGTYNLNGTMVKVAGALFVTRPGFLSSEIIDDFGDKLMMGTMTDGDFNDAEDHMGNDQYYDVAIDTKAYRGLEYKGIGDIDVLGVRAVVMYNPDFLDRLDGDRRDERRVKTAINKGIAKSLKGLK